MARASRVGSVVDNALLAVCFIGSLIALILPAPIRDRSAGALRRTVVAPFAELQRRAETSRAAFLSYGDRMDRSAQIAKLQSDVVALQSENRRLRSLLGLGSRLEWGFIAAEASPAQLESGLVQRQILQTFNVTAGARAGVQPFTPVVAPEGLVGMVETVDPTSSIAISYAHPDFRVSATTPNDSAFGIVQAHLGSGTGRGLLEMRGVPFRSPLKAGQVIISSGLGGTYPRGIPIGTVIREIQTPEKWARTYLLQPAVELSEIGPVFLTLKKRAEAEGGVATVWMTPSAADSAARSIAAAGDSLARDAAMREMAARRAALDSVRGATPADSLRADSAGAGPTTPATVPPGTVPPATAPRPTVPAPTTGAPRATAPAGTAAPAGTTPRRPATDTGARTNRPATPAPTAPRPTVPRPTVPVPGRGA